MFKQILKIYFSWITDPGMLDIICKANVIKKLQFTRNDDDWRFLLPKKFETERVAISICDSYS